MPTKKIKAVKKAAKRAYDVLRDGDEQAKRRYREKIREAKDSPYPYSKKEKKEIRQYGATKAEMREEYNTAKDEISQTVSDMGGFSKGGMLIKGLKKLAGKDKKKSRPDLEAKAKRKKKMDAEKPAVPTLRRDMRNRVAEKQFKKATGSKPEFRKPVKKSKGGMVTKWEQKWG